MNETILVSAITGVTVSTGLQPLHDWLRRVDRGPATSLRAEMHAVGMDALLLPVYLAAWRGAALAILLIGSIQFGMPIFAVTLAGIVHFAYPWWVRGRIRSYVRSVIEQLPAATRNLEGAIRVGMPLRAAFVDTARNAPAPVGAILGSCAQQMNAGIDAYSALETLKQKVKVEPVVSLATALQVAEKHGRVGDVIQRIGDSVDESLRLERKRLADTSSGRLMIRLMAVFPVGFLLFLNMLHPDLLRILTGTFYGECTMTIVAILVYVGMRWGSWILNR